MSKETLTLEEINRALARKKHGKKAKKKTKRKAKRKSKRRAKAKVKVVHVHHHHGAKKTARKRASKKRPAKKRASKKRQAKKRAKKTGHTGADMTKAERKAWAKKMQLARARAKRRK